MKLTKDEFKLAKQEFDQEGYIVFEELISHDEVANYISALKPYLSKDVKGRNNFEGHNTNRVYGLLDKSPVFGEMVEYPLVMQFVRDELGESALLSALLAINLMPGETVQPWHTDDGYVHVEMPHPSFGISAFWALSDTNKENGATEVLPGSHKWEKEKLARYIKLDDYHAEGFLGYNLAEAPDSEKKVIEICRAVGASVYINSIGGRELYDAQTFRGRDLELRFLKSNSLIVLTEEVSYNFSTLSTHHIHDQS